MPDIFKAILDSITNTLTPAGVMAFLLIAATVYIWYQYHSKKIMEERLGLIQEKKADLEEQRKALIQELEALSKSAKTSIKPPPPLQAVKPSPKVVNEKKQRETVKQILIVDDDPDIRTLLRIYLESQFREFSIVTAKDGFEALDYINQQKPSLIILDQFMPRMDGYDTLEILDREDEKIPILIMSPRLTTKSELTSKYKNFQDNQIDFLAKPFMVEELGIKARNLLTFRN